MVLGVKNFIRNITGRQNAVLAAMRNVVGDSVSIYRNPDLNCISEIFSKKVKLFKVLDKKTKLTTKYVGCNFNKNRELESIFVFNKRMHFNSLIKFLFFFF